MTSTSSPATVRLATLAFAAATALTPALPRPAAAQANPSISNAIPASELATLYGKITHINPKTRSITLRGRSGVSVTIIAGPAVRLELLKTGDTVTAKYYRSVAFLVVPPSGGGGTPAPANDGMAALLAQPAQAPGGIGVRVTKITGMVVGIDLAANRLDLVNPTGGGVISVDVTDPARIAAMAQLKVGDRITAVVSEALAVSVEAAPKGWL
jgi:hypothetical protein